jgi:type I restriction enzyme M protein
MTTYRVEYTPAAARQIRKLNKTVQARLKTQIAMLSENPRPHGSKKLKNLPAKLFLNTQIPASLWFLSRNKANGKFRNRTDDILFIDARNLGHLINRRTRELSDEDIQKISDTYHQWRNLDGDYEGIKGFCKSATVAEVEALDYVLTPGRYVGLEEVEDDFDFKERFSQLKAEFEGQLKEEAELNQRILDNLGRVKI